MGDNLRRKALLDPTEFRAYNSLLFLIRGNHTSMSNSLFSAEEAAELLQLHVKTVRRYIREGKLKAKRIGKEYRIARADLEAFAGAELVPSVEVARTRQIIVSSVVDVDVVRPEESDRITTLIMASLNTRRDEGMTPRVDGIYYPELAKLRITITADPISTIELLRMIHALLEAGRDKYL